MALDAARQCGPVHPRRRGVVSDAGPGEHVSMRRVVRAHVVVVGVGVWVGRVVQGLVVGYCVRMRVGKEECGVKTTTSRVWDVRELALAMRRGAFSVAMVYGSSMITSE